MDFEIHTAVSCTDGSAGKVVALIADPVARELTHIAVEPGRNVRDDRLVPVGLVAAASPAGVELRCSLAELERLPEFHDVEFVPYTADDLGDSGAMLAWPYYELPDPMVPLVGDLGTPLAWPYHGRPGEEHPVIVDRVPSGEVEIRRNEQVHAVDGAIGRVEGLVVDNDGHITHVLLQEGHFWGKREVAIPINSVEKIEAEGIHVQLSKREIEDLPTLGVDPPGRRGV
jgi:hypothetical protein